MERISLTRGQLEQALQDSEMQEIIYSARMAGLMYNEPLRRALCSAIIDRLLLWQQVFEGRRS